MMNQPLTNVVYPVFTNALKLKERLDRGEAPDIGKEQGVLLGLLKNVPENPRGGEGKAFLGIRYALASWIDELFIVHCAPSRWADEWNRRKLEIALYGGASERAWKFWKQAEMAVGQADALEVFFLCVVLGFRGQYLDDPARLKNWIDEILPQVMKAGKWQEPHDLGVTTRIEPLVGRETLRRRLVVRGGLAMVVFLTLLILLRINYYY